MLLLRSEMNVCLAVVGKRLRVGTLGCEVTK